MTDAHAGGRERWGLAFLLGLGPRIAGCLQPLPGQMAWHDRLLAAVDETYAGDTLDLPRAFTTKELSDVAGSPDAVLTPASFEAALPVSLECREEIMNYLRLASAQPSEKYAISAGSAQSATLPTTDLLWIYEKNRHFRRPMPAWGWSPGFICYIFVARDGTVVGAHEFISWVPLRAMN